MLLKQYYSELGKLLYAIAEIDGKISNQEKEKLKELIRCELAPTEIHKDEYGTDAAYYAEIEFDIMEESMSEPDEAYESFINFIDEHRTAINNIQLHRALRLATKLADTYYHTNKKEHQFLDKLQSKLDSIIKGNSTKVKIE